MEKINFPDDLVFDRLYTNSRVNAVAIMDLQGNIIQVNKAFTSAFGYTSEDLAGKNFRILFTEADRAAQKPEHELQQVVLYGQGDDKNFLVQKDQSPVWVSGESVLINQPKEKFILKVIQDISDLKRAELAITKAYEFAEKILTSIDDIVVVLNQQLEIIKSNDAFEKVFGTHPVQDFKTILATCNAQEKLYDLLKHTVNSGISFDNLELEIIEPKGEHVFSCSGRPLEIPDLKEGVLLIMHAITLQKQSEREREDIIGFVAHELRNPLSNVVLCNELMKEVLHKKDLSKAFDLVQRNQHNIFRLNAMIADLYDATKINSGNFILEITSFDFDDMIREAVETVLALQPAFNITITGKGQYITADRQRLLQVVINYLSNGIKYANGNSTIEVMVSNMNGMVTVAVRDYGLGISASQLPQLFNRFFRAEKTKNLEGIGLGLFLCSRIIEAHHGKVWAESQEGSGSTFYFSIPETATQE